MSLLNYSIVFVTSRGSFNNPDPETKEKKYNDGVIFFFTEKRIAFRMNYQKSSDFTLETLDKRVQSEVKKQNDSFNNKVQSVGINFLFYKDIKFSDNPTLNNIPTFQEEKNNSSKMNILKLNYIIDKSKYLNLTASDAKMDKVTNSRKESKEVTIFEVNYHYNLKENSINIEDIIKETKASYKAVEKYIKDF